LQAYIRRLRTRRLGSLQYVMAGAEKLPERTSIAFEDRFDSARWKAMAAPSARRQ